MAQFSPLKQPVVLVVEDEPILRLAALDLVADAGLNPIGAADANEALRILESGLDICIVFTDVDMPRGVNGLALARIIRERWPLVQIIVTSGKAAAARSELLADCVFFAKPYMEERVAEEMQRMSGQAQVHAGGGSGIAMAHANLTFYSGQRDAGGT